MKKLRLVLTIDRILQLSDKGRVETVLPDGQELDIILPEGVKAQVYSKSEEGEWIKYPSGRVN